MKKKFSFPEALIMLLMTFTADSVEILVMTMGVIPIITPISIGVSWLINTFVLGALLLWFIIKGERGLWAISGSLLEYVPFLNALPLRTATCALAIYIANHPKVKQVATHKKSNVVQLKKNTQPQPQSEDDSLKKAA